MDWARVLLAFFTLIIDHIGNLSAAAHDTATSAWVPTNSHVIWRLVLISLITVLLP